MKWLCGTATRVFLLCMLCSIGHSQDISAADCGNTTTCFRQPNSCTSSSNCDFIIKFKYDETAKTIDIDVGARSAKWVAVGFNSKEKKMDGARGEMCINLQPIKLLEFQNSGYAPSTRDSSFTLLSSQQTNGALVCRFTRPLLAPQNSFSVNLDKSWFVHGVWGEKTSGSGPSQHSFQAYGSTSSPIKVTVISSVLSTVPSLKLVAAHGSVMIIAWFTLAVVGFFGARYMKPVFQEAFGLKIWFWIHRTCMASAFLLTIIGIILIFVHKKAWSGSESALPHAVIGIIITVLALLQVVFATFRPHPGTPNRWIFNWAHRLEGMLAIILAVVNIFLGLQLVDVDGDGPLIGAIVVGVVFIIILEAHSVFTNRVSSDARVEYKQGEATASTPGTLQPTNELTKMGTLFRMILFFLLAFILGVVAIVCIVLITKKIVV